MQTGAVEKRRSTPANGATSTEPATLTKCSDTRPSPAAISAHSPTRPTWPDRRRPTADKPHRLAFLDPDPHRLRRRGLSEAEMSVENGQHRRIDDRFTTRSGKIMPSCFHCT